MTNLLALNNFQNGLFTFILGLLVVFLGMLVIVFAISLAGKAISGKKEKPQKEEVVQSAPAPAVVQQPIVEEGIPEDVRVAIIAAIAAYYNSNQPQPEHEFKVRKIKKLNR